MIASRTISLTVSLSLFCLSDMSATAQIQKSREGSSLGGQDITRIEVVTPDRSPICKSFAFSQIPGSPELFVGKYRSSTAQNVCGGAQTIALFKFNWTSHVMTVEHALLDIPTQVGTGTVANAYDPYVENFGGETWVAFECTGPHIPGTSACIAPLSGTERLDMTRASIPVVGLDVNPRSDYSYSTSTPKLLSFKGRLYLYWSAIQAEKAPPRRWDSVETRGVELQQDSEGRLWAKDHPGRPIASHSPGQNIAVMKPIPNDPYRNISVDTEGLYGDGDDIIVLSSVGGSGPDGRLPCTKPGDKTAGCYRLEITRTKAPLGEDSFREQTLVSPDIPTNPAEYPRIVIGADKKTYLMVNWHPVSGENSQAGPGRAIAAGLALIPFPLSDARFSTSRE